MQLHSLQSKTSRTYAKPRVGRGGKRGTTAGKGTKGQKSRSGRRIRPALREYIQRLPKLRGQRNQLASDSAAVITLTMLEKIGSPINAAKLVEAGFARKGQSIKILATGAVTKAIVVEGVAVSGSARAAIEKAGGKVSEVTSA